MKKRPDIDSRQSVTDKFFVSNRLHLDTRFVLRDGKIHPAAVICPGGAYEVVCSYIEGVPIARRLNELGISAFIVYYRVRDKARYPAPQEDLAKAVRTILERAEEYRIDPESYSVWGSSAGGHLVASFGTESMGYPLYGLPRPAAMVLAYPVISLCPELTHKGTHDNLLGADAEEQEEHFASIDEQVTAFYPPTYIWCGDADKSVPPENTRRMAAALAEAGVRHACDIFPGVEHGVGPGTGTSAEGWIDRAVSFWLG